MPQTDSPIETSALDVSAGAVESGTAGSARDLAMAKLTALWALSEGGLGGILHATKLPMRGVILACIAAISICLISHVSRKRTAALRAAVIVLAIKAVLAPHSVGGGYVAVLNQALLGTLCMILFGPSLVGCLMTGLLALIETSLHRLLWASVLGGADFWSSLDQLLLRGQEWLVGRVVIDEPARWMVIIYVGIHAAFGLLAGFIAWRLPRVAQRILASQPTPPTTSDKRNDAAEGGARKKKRWARSAKGIVLILAVITLAGPGLAAGGYGPWYWRFLVATVRVVCIVLVFIFIVRPIVVRLMERLLRRGRRQGEFTDTLESVRALRSEVLAVWQQADGMRLWRRLLHCVAVLFASALVDADRFEGP